MLGAVRARCSGIRRFLAAHDLDEAFEHARAPQGVDLVLLDLSPAGLRRHHALARFRQAFPQVRVVVVSSAPDRNCVLVHWSSAPSDYVRRRTTLRSSPPRCTWSAKAASTFRSRRSLTDEPQAER